MWIDKWEKYLSENNDKRKKEPIEIIYPSNLSIAGVMNSANETLVNGKNVYKRILIKRK